MSKDVPQCIEALCFILFVIKWQIASEELSSMQFKRPQNLKILLGLG
jgi:hypothetical protein